MTKAGLDQLRPCLVRDCVEFVVTPALFCFWLDKDRIHHGHWTMIGEGAQLAIYDAGPELRLDLAKAAAERIEKVEKRRLKRPRRRKPSR